MAFRYEAYTEGGDTVTGTLEVDSEEAAEELLWHSNLTVLNLQRERKPLSLEEMLPTLMGPKKRDVITFTRQLTTLLSSGVSILPALRLLADETSNAIFANVLRTVAQDIQRGESFSQSLARHPAVFPTIYIRLAAVGEGTGRMETVLHQLADYLEKEEALLSKIRGAMVYPAIILCLATVVILVFLNFVLPSIMGLFSEFQAQLPLPTRALIMLTNVVKAIFIQIMLFLAALGGFLWWFIRTPRGKKLLDTVILKVPIIKTVVLKGQTARLSSTMSMLLAAGLSVTESMDLIIGSMQNMVLREALEKARTDVLEGISLSESLERRKVFPSILGQMMRVGEETGALTTNLDVLARFYEEETDRAVTQMVSMIEPAMIVGMGAFIAFLAVSIITPMYSVLQTIK
ncbi:MAG: type II secretion system F family protein [Chloroflexi bacterium]|nr:type II secretion system F family protein [Chloroflexota bacterium]